MQGPPFLQHHAIFGEGEVAGTITEIAAHDDDRLDNFAIFLCLLIKWKYITVFIRASNILEAKISGKMLQSPLYFYIYSSKGQINDKYT